MRPWRTRYRHRTDALTPIRGTAVGDAWTGWPRHHVVIACCALLPMVVACVTQDRYDLMTAQRDDLEGTRIRLERKLERLEAANTSLVTERDELLDEFEDQRIVGGRLEGEVRRLKKTGTQLTQNLEQTSALLARREAEISAMRGTYDALVGDLQAEVAAGQIEIERLSSGLNLNLSQGVLFGTATAEVSASGKVVLRKLAARLSRISYRVEIIGHTDNVPIGVLYPSNWELAAARASSVVRLLAASGVDPARMSAVSRGEHEPIASNQTAQGRASNRRIEIRLTPESTEPGRGASGTVSETVPEPEPEPKPEPETGVRPDDESSETPMPGDPHGNAPES